MGYSPRTISVDHETWEKARDVVKEQTGMTMSKFIEIYLRGVARAKAGSLRDVVYGATSDLIEMDDLLTIREKQKMNGLFDQIKKPEKVKKKKSK